MYILQLFFNRIQGAMEGNLRGVPDICNHLRQCRSAYKTLVLSYPHAFHLLNCEPAAVGPKGVRCLCWDNLLFVKNPHLAILLSAVPSRLLARS